MADQQPREDEVEFDAGEDGGGLLEEIGDEFRGTGVGTQDPNIVGNVGPLDIPPGEDDDWTPEGSESGDDGAQV